MRRQAVSLPRPDREGALAAAAQALLVRAGRSIESEVRGGSMTPTLPHGIRIRIDPADLRSVTPGTVLAFRAGDLLMAHRVVASVRDLRGRRAWLTRGDALRLCDRPVEPALVLGVVGAAHDGRDWHPVADPPGERSTVAAAMLGGSLLLARLDLRFAAWWAELWAFAARRTTRRDPADR